jgi:hypothetical protein
MITYKLIIISLLFLTYPCKSQEVNHAEQNFWKCYLNDNTVHDSVVLVKRENSFLFISNGDSLQRIQIYNIDHISKSIIVTSNGREILGATGGAVLGGIIGILIAPKVSLFGDGASFAPHGKYYIAGGAILGGVIGYVAFKPKSEKIYQLKGLKWENRLALIDNIIKNRE